MKFKELKIEVPEWQDVKGDSPIWAAVVRWPRDAIHKAVQQHAFNLGYEWPDGDNYVRRHESHHLYFSTQGKLTRGVKLEWFHLNEKPQISWQDFLKLSKADVIIDETENDTTRIEINQMMEPRIDMSSFTHRFIMSHP